MKKTCFLRFVRILNLIFAFLSIQSEKSEGSNGGSRGGSESSELHGTEEFGILLLREPLVVKSGFFLLEHDLESQGRWGGSFGGGLDSHGSLGTSGDLEGSGVSGLIEVGGKWVHIDSDELWIARTSNLNWVLVTHSGGGSLSRSPE